MQNFTDSLVTDTKPETKENIRTAAIMLFLIPQKKPP
jgi:hypothetical protein